MKVGPCRKVCERGREREVERERERERVYLNQSEFVDGGLCEKELSMIE